MFNYNQLKYQISLIRNTEYPQDSEYLSKLGEYTITLNQDQKEMPFCVFRIEFENIKLKRREGALVFTTPFQINLLSNSIHIKRMALSE